MALQGWEAGELWAQLRAHNDGTGHCPIDRRRDCAAYGYAREALVAAELLEPQETPDLAAQIAALTLEWK